MQFLVEGQSRRVGQKERGIGVGEAWEGPVSVPPSMMELDHFRLNGNMQR